MKHLAVYLLLKLGGNASPSKDDIVKALSSVGVAVDAARLDKMMADLQGKDLNELLESGKALLTTFDSGSGSGCGGGGGGGGPAAAPAADVKVVQEKEEEEAEIDVGGGMNLFQGEEDDGGGCDY
jgi:large subunit ribosomal protein LP2